jgi:hypothetical protein
MTPGAYPLGLHSGMLCLTLKHYTRQKDLGGTNSLAYLAINVEGVTLVLPSRLFMFNKYWRILALS